MVKSVPFSVRLPARLDSEIADEAKRTRRSKGAVLESLADEALRCRRFPGISFKGREWNRRAWVMGTSMYVFQVIWALRDFGSIKKMTQALSVSEEQIKIAQAYYREYPDEIDEAIGANSASLEELQKKFPWIDTAQVAE